MENLFYYILTCVVTDTDIDTEALQGLSGEDWKLLFEMLRRQGVSAVVFDKVRLLPKKVAPPVEVQFKWCSQAVFVEQQITKMFSLAADFAEKMYDNGIPVVVLKGLAFGVYYPNPMSRECGDLDCFMLGKGKEGDAVTIKIGGAVEDGGYKHSHTHYKGLTIENHYYLTNFNNTAKGRYTERYLQQLIQENHTKIQGTHLLNPAPDFNAFFLIKHAQMHFILEGIHVRHLLDWAFFLRKEQENVHWDQLLPEMKKCGVLRFAQVMTEICVEKFGLEVAVEALRIPAEDRRGHTLAQQVLTDIMNGHPDLHKENFAQKCARIARRFVRMWKFRTLADESYLTLVWNAFAFSSYLKRSVDLE